MNAPPFAEPAALVDVGIAAERAGWDAFLLWDHMVLDRQGIPIADPWVTLGAVAAKTERIRLGTCVTPLARRRPQKLARETVTLDRLSRGRLILGVGLGYPADDYTTFGESADLHTLAARTDEALTVLSGLWSGEPFEHAGPFFSVERVTFLPTPVQRPRPPVWIACLFPAPRAITRAARWDGVVPIKVGATGIEFLTPDDIARIVDDIRQRRGTLDAFDVVADAGSSPSSAAAYEAAGANWWITSLYDDTSSVDALEQLVEAGPPRD